MQKPESSESKLGSVFWSPWADCGTRSLGVLWSRDTLGFTFNPKAGSLALQVSPRRTKRANA